MPVAAWTALPRLAASAAETAVVPGDHWSVKPEARARRALRGRDRGRAGLLRQILREADEERLAGRGASGATGRDEQGRQYRRETPHAAHGPESSPVRPRPLPRDG